MSRYELPHGAWTFTGFLIVVLQPSADVDLYRTAAAMIPTLLLTLAVAGRFYVVNRAVAGFRRYDPAFILLEIAAGEAAALAVVAGVEPHPALLAFVCGSLASVFVAITMLAITGVTEATSAD
ncbi:MAG: hypothetical protein ACRDLZ_05130 [Gaiellaceae bacterium]